MAQPDLSTALPTRPRRNHSTSGQATTKPRWFTAATSRSPRGRSKSPFRPGRGNSHSVSRPAGTLSRPPFLQRPYLNRSYSHHRPSTPHPVLPDHTDRNTNFNKRMFSVSHDERIALQSVEKRPRPAWESALPGLSHLPAPVPGSSRELVASLRESYRGRETTERQAAGDTDFVVSNEQGPSDRRRYVGSRGTAEHVQVLWSERTRAGMARMTTNVQPSTTGNKGKGKRAAYLDDGSYDMVDDQRHEELASTPTAAKVQTLRKGVKRTRFAFTEPEPEPWTLCPPNEAKAMMPPEIAEQYELAGLEYHQPLPRGFFPHTAIEHAPFVSWRRNVLSKADVNAELNQLKPPPKGTDADMDVNRVLNPAKTPQRQALHTLIAIVNRMITEGDYKRAGRAFGLLLRTRMGQKALDLRSTHEWGRAAEILLHHDNPIPPRAKLRNLRKKPKITYIDKDPDGNKSQTETFYPDSDDEGRRRAKAKKTRKTAENFENELKERPETTKASWAKAMEFFEYLVMQYPPMAGDSGSWQVNAFGFYHQMYESWILHIEELRKSEEVSAHRRFNLLGNDDDGTEDDGKWLPVNPDNERLLSAVGDIVQATYERAGAVAEHMDGVLASLPYSNDHDLVALRAKVERWLAELIVPMSTRIQLSFHGKSDNEKWNEDLVWAPNEIEYNRDGRAVRQSPGSDSSSDSDQDKQHGPGDANTTSSDQRRELQHAKKAKGRHVRKATRLMGSSVFLRRSAHLRMNGWGGQAIEENRFDNDG